MQIAIAACASDLWPFEEILVTVEGGRKIPFSQPTEGEGKLVRILIAAEQPRTQMPKQAKSQSPELRIGGAMAQRPALRNLGARLIPTQESANSFMKMLF